MVKLYKKTNIENVIIIFNLLLFLTIPFLICGCTIFPTPPNNVTGNIQINSEPAGASIYLDGLDTGYTSPKLIKNISIGSYLVTFKLEGYLNSNNFIQIYPNQTAQLNVQLTPNPYLPSPAIGYLLKIEAEPEMLTLFPGEASYILSITAYYSDGTYQNIAANQCNMYSNQPNVATVNQFGQISALSEGQTTIWINYTETGITKNDSILVIVNEFNPNLGNLISIDVLPETMNLDIGESKQISSITAYYDSGSEQLINPEQCDLSVNNSFVVINNSGIVTGNSYGTSIVTVTYTDGNITKSATFSATVSQNVANQPTYRGLVIGIGDYIYYGEEGDLLAPPYDVNKVKDIFYDCRFGSEGTPFNKINELKNTQATKSNIFQKIQSVFSGADENDISYFYFSGHGTTVNQMSYLCPADFNGNIATAISVDELESALSAIPGTKVVFIDSCHSGGFVGKDNILRNDVNVNTEEAEEYLANFNQSIVNIFSERLFSKDLLTSSEYQVLTSSHWYQPSYELYPPNDDPFGVFTQALYEGCSLDYNSQSDLNKDNKITLHEAYDFISQWVRSMRINQNVQIYPLNSSFTIIEY